MTKKENRHQLRECAFQALLAMEFGSDWESALAFAYQHDREETEGARTDVSDLPVFLRALVEGVFQHQQELDSLLTSKLKSGWTIERLTLVDKTLLRLGLYEIAFHQETPDKVAVNEAIELAKEYSDKQAASFVNGVLSQFVKES